MRAVWLRGRSMWSYNLYLEKKSSAPDELKLARKLFHSGSRCFNVHFFTIRSYDYRIIFLLFTFPYILDLAKSPTVGRSFQFAARTLLVLLLTMMWVETVYIFLIFDPVQLRFRWNADHLRSVLLFKHGIAWVVMAMLTGFGFLLLKPNAVLFSREFLHLRRDNPKS